MEQFNAATEALCVPIDKSRPQLNPGEGREFNLDIAKLLFVFLAFQYSRDASATVVLTPRACRRFRFLSMRLAAVVYEYRNQDLRKLIVDASKPSARPAPTAPKVSYRVDKLSFSVYIMTFVSGFCLQGFHLELGQPQVVLHGPW